MKLRNAIFFTVLFAEIALISWPFIPGIKSLLPDNPTAREQLDMQIAIIGTGFALLTVSIGAIFHREADESEKFRATVEENLPITTVTQIRDDEFYSAFFCAAQTATSSVNIMYMAPRAPDATNDEARLEYYKSMRNLIRRKTDVKFNRIIRDTVENRKWTETLIQDLVGCANASIVILKDNKSDEMPLTLSTQIIDSRKVWLVAVSAHERRGSYRDLFIENPKVADAMQHYFDRLWSRGTKLLDAGRLTADGNKFLLPKEFKEI